MSALPSKADRLCCCDLKRLSRARNPHSSDVAGQTEYGANDCIR